MKKSYIILTLLFIFTLTIFVTLFPSKTKAQVTAAACPSGLVSYWRGDGDTTDSIGLNNGQFVDNAQFTTGKVNQAFNFDGGYFKSGSLNLPTGNAPRTLEFWVKSPNMAVGDTFLAGWGNNANYQMSSIFLGWANQRSSRYASWEFGTSVIGSVLANDTWYHLAMTYDGTTNWDAVKIYLNGARDTESWYPYVTQNLITPPGTDFIMAFNSFFEEYYKSHPDGQLDHRFHGAMDEVAVFNYVLTEAEINQHYQNGVAVLPYCEPTVNVAIDIKPGSTSNCFNNNGYGALPVAILGSSNFDANQVNPETVALNGMVVKAVGKSNKLLAHIEDTNSDGFMDMVVQIQDADGAYASGETLATLAGKTFSGKDIKGTDTICIVP
ncbi:hypothetical protein A3B40_04640 [Candidatus Roizmanbacteria bacterium RIFCSPLOWO2_01_FULL_37_16]|uniref:LamG-like jellyroll fold domain-containing protein n=1 Tax=Candidatus Roizmanbacteria bacterium RIFCSPLOWO2_01_FULL_37_16 TaxID=1802058 RepID=A0A1F7IJR3_9BACT|nr:MAG: hypothetical protein A3B40_04640 [Candidatus Roizmanbacteria bacterium RIFCSPLOWO2_01_FULL_37_16]